MLTTFIVGGVKMNKISIVLCLLVNIVFADSKFIAGYGVSSYDVPIINNGNVFSHNLYAGIDNYYDVNSTDQIVLSTILSTNRRFDTSFLSEFELQMGFKKKLTTKDSIAFGAHVSHLLNENVPEVELIGTGFGLNMAYTHQYSEKLSMNFQVHSTSYGVSSSANGFERFTNQTIRTFIGLLP